MIIYVLSLGISLSKIYHIRGWVVQIFFSYLKRALCLF